MTTLTDTTRRWIPAPQPSPFPVSSGDILGVYVSEDERVIWEFTGMGASRRVTGYTIVKATGQNNK